MRLKPPASGKLVTPPFVAEEVAGGVAVKSGIGVAVGIMVAVGTGVSVGVGTNSVLAAKTSPPPIPNNDS